MLVGYVVAGILIGPYTGGPTVTASINQPALETALAKANNGDVTVSLVAGVNHLFLAAEEANVQAWATLPQTLAPQVVETIADWLVVRTHI
jgi:glycosyltransferase A (GT-A) superfamily protein (DUF2064 family)